MSNSPFSPEEEEALAELQESFMADVKDCVTQFIEIASSITPDLEAPGEFHLGQACRIFMNYISEQMGPSVEKFEDIESIVDLFRISMQKSYLKDNTDFKSDLH